MPEDRPPTARPLSPRAQAILQRFEREAEEAARATEPGMHAAVPPPPVPPPPRPSPPSPPSPSERSHGLARPRPPAGEAPPIAPPGRNPAFAPPIAAAAGTDPPERNPAVALPTAAAADTDHLLALVNALARRTEVARRQLEELTSALDVLTRGLAGPADAPAAESRPGPPAVPLPPTPSTPLRRPGEPAPPPGVRWPSERR
jgi:hypothetical protein